MQERLKELQQEAIQKIEQSSSLKELNDIRVAYLGKKGPITEVLRGMGKPLTVGLQDTIAFAVFKFPVEFYVNCGCYEQNWHGCKIDTLYGIKSV